LDRVTTYIAPCPLVKLAEAIARTAPINTAPIPLAADLSLKDDIWTWTVDVHVRIPHKTEFECTATGSTLQEAATNAFRAFRTETYYYNRENHHLARDPEALFAR
jgi:hypothetical protein